MAFTILKECIGCAVCTKVCPVNAISGERNQRHKIDAALCIDCYACGYICPQSAVKDSREQVVQRIRFRRNWPKPKITQETCMSCTICLDSCPTGCLSLIFTQDTSDTRGYPDLARPGDCIACGFCAADCPVAAIEMIEPKALSSKSTFGIQRTRNE